ncbi:NUMOD4 motif-containing HNH endonuclease [Microbacterium terrisoli]|uniref:NUMOD4 motif-containing HNH endonuclease n=1 Tax=Microbacterium terrisoli TaxID=3242192 RepID=UPI00350E42A6
MTEHKTEEWRPVAGFEDRYQVSDGGHVMSLIHPKTRILAGSMAGDGYRKVILCPAVGKRVHVYVHRLVLSTFVGPCPLGMEACHGNGNRQDNRLANLRWDTPSENNRDIVRLGNHNSANRTSCPQGHALTWPNLVLSELRHGGRKCRACSQARAILQRRDGDAQAISDERYALILRGVA